MLPVAATLVLAGIALAALGLRGRRVGDEPRCRKCKYNLTGVEADKCPECGRPWTPATAARGLRVRRKRPLAIGAAIFLLGAGLTAAIITGRVRKINWFTHLPTPWVVPFAARGNTDAFTTLANRFDNDKLSPSQIADLTETGLALQANPQLKATTQDWINLLARLEARGRLTTQQRDRFFSQMVLLDLVMRRPIERDRCFVGELHKRWRAPENSLMEWQLDMLSATLDGQPFDTHPMIIARGANYLSPRGARRFNEAQLMVVIGREPPPPPGVHDLQINCRSEFQSFMARRYDPIWSGDLILRASVEIVDAKKSPMPKTVDDPETIQRILAALEFTVTATPSYRGKSNTLAIDWKLAAPSPTDAWIEVRTRPRRGGLSGFFDFDKTIYLPQGLQLEGPTELGSIESARLVPGDQLTLWLYADERGHEFDGAGTSRLKPGVPLGQVQVPIQSFAPPASPRATGS